LVALPENNDEVEDEETTTDTTIDTDARPVPFMASLTAVHSKTIAVTGSRRMTTRQPCPQVLKIGALTLLTVNSPSVSMEGIKTRSNG
jgi:hypothetical protein